MSRGGEKEVGVDGYVEEEKEGGGGGREMWPPPLGIVSSGEQRMEEDGGMLVPTGDIQLPIIGGVKSTGELKIGLRYCPYL